jgi:effector-binding domain-containing protein/uncharacterized membrane protein
MKSLLKIMYLLVTLLILAILAGLFLPRNGSVKSEIVINAPVQLIFNQVNSLQNWEKWSPWYKTDSTMKFIYSGPVNGTGAMSVWTSEHSGKGKLTITASEPLEKVETSIDFGVDGMSSAGFQFEPVDGGRTKLVWTFYYKELGYLERYFMVLFDRNIRSTFSNGLRNIKEICEELRLDRNSEIKIVETVLQPSLGIIDSCSQEQLTERIASGFAKLSAYISKRNIQPDSLPFILYYRSVSKNNIKFACCLPIPERTWGWKEYTYIELPQGRAATLTHWGKHETAKPYRLLDSYLQQKNLSKENYYWEVNLKDASSTADTSLWEKQIYYPIK